MGVRKKWFVLAMVGKVTLSHHFKPCSSACGHFTHMGFIRQRNILCEALVKVAISAAKYVALSFRIM